MAIKVFISGVCGSQEVRKRQQRVLFVLTSMRINYETVDITEPGKDEDREYMKEQGKLHNKENILPPQIFNDSEYCGDYSDFEVANDDDKLLVFLKLQDESVANEITMNGDKEENEKKDEEHQAEKGEKDTDIFSNEDDGTMGDSGVGEENKDEEKEEEKEEEKPKDDTEQSKVEESEEEEKSEEED